MKQQFTVPAEWAGATLAAALRYFLPGYSWKQVRRLVAGRRICLSGSLCLDAARRLQAGETIELLPRAAPPPPTAEELTIYYVDAHLVVVEKPAGLRTVPHPQERDWSARRKALHPTLVDLVARRLAASEALRVPRRGRRVLPRLRVVHRLDKETSGLLVLARSVEAERGLGKQFQAHTILRRYLALVPGQVRSQRIISRLVRDRGDGRRGSTPLAGVGKEAITQIEVVERLPRHTLLACRLQTGRTHQIRIHLSELGHPVCGEKVYIRRLDGTPLPVCPEAPRLALHAAELGLVHPINGQWLHWQSPLPADLQAYLERLRRGG
jgi:23S rRNA pseudouridine1911/1915/1917 synthase